MLELTRLGGPPVVLNPDLIERIESTPDTLITLVSGNRYLVAESPGEVAELVDLHRASVIAAAGSLLDGHPPASLRVSAGSVVPLRPQDA